MENNVISGKSEPPSVKRELFKEATGWLLVVFLALVLAWVLTNFVVVNATVPTGSMKGTIQPNDRIMAFRLSYIFGSQPERYDIIVFRGAQENASLYVKRVIGVPGDIITITDGRVYLYGYDEPLRDDFVHGEFWGNYGPYEIPEGYFFVLGDYRINSIDSRHWREQPFVARSQIQGRVIFRYFPGFQNLN